MNQRGVLAIGAGVLVAVWAAFWPIGGQLLGTTYSCGVPVFTAFHDEPEFEITYHPDGTETSNDSERSVFRSCYNRAWGRLWGGAAVGSVLMMLGAVSVHLDQRSERSARF